jgi:hypothetical protein
MTDYKRIVKVDANGNLSVINRVYMLVYSKSGCMTSIWVVPQKLEFIGFCPCIGMRAFFAL